MSRPVHVCCCHLEFCILQSEQSTGKKDKKSLASFGQRTTKLETCDITSSKLVSIKQLKKGTLFFRIKPEKIVIW